MTGTELSNDEKLLAELRETVKKLPLNERKQAAALYSIFEQILANKKEEEKQNETAFTEYSGAINTITSSMDEIIEGKRKVTEAELGYWRDNVDAAFEAAPEHNTEAPLKGFWRKFIENSGIYHGEHDLPVLDHLVHVEVSDEHDKEDPTVSCLGLTLEFSANEYFKNGTLKTKLFTKEGQLQRSEGTAIEWTNNPTVKKTTKTQKNKRTGQTRTITKENQLKSFFEIFGSFSADDGDDKDDKGDDEEDGPSMNIWTLSETLEQVNDYLPYALEYYLGVVDEDDSHGDCDDCEEDDEEDGDDDDSEEHRHPHHHGKKGGKTESKKDSKKASRKHSEAEKKKEDKPKEEPKDPKNPECKQQ